MLTTTIVLFALVVAQAAGVGMALRLVKWTRP
jgi:hypothetical protein